jgi:hypothetical protein
VINGRHRWVRGPLRIDGSISESEDGAKHYWETRKQYNVVHDVRMLVIDYTMTRYPPLLRLFRLSFMVILG